MVFDAFEGQRLLLERVTTHEFDRAVFEIAASHGQTHGHTLQFVVREFEARTLVVGVVVFHAQTLRLEALGEFAEHGVEFLLFAVFENRHDHHLDRCHVGREHQTVVVAVAHDERTHQARRHAPRRGPSILFLVVFVDKLHVEGLTEVLSEEVRGAALQRFAVLHHRFDGVGVECSGKAFRGALDAAHHGDGEHVLGKVGIDVEHLLGAGFGLFAGGVCRVSFLPEEFRRAEEQTRAHFPAHHVAPLVAQHGQIAPRFDPTAIGVPDRGFGGGANDELFFEFRRGVHHYAVAFFVCFESIVGHHSAFFGKSFHVLRFFRKIAFGDEQGEVGVLHARGFETGVECLLYPFPDGITIGLDHHAAAHGRLFGEVGFHDEFVVPARIVHAAFGEVFQFFGHYRWYVCSENHA